MHGYNYFISVFVYQESINFQIEKMTIYKLEAFIVAAIFSRVQIYRKKIIYVQRKRAKKLY